MYTATKQIFCFEQLASEATPTVDVMKTLPAIELKFQYCMHARISLVAVYISRCFARTRLIDQRSVLHALMDNPAITCAAAMFKTFVLI